MARTQCTADDENVWLALSRLGQSTACIASEAGCSQRRVQLGLARARAREGQTGSTEEITEPRPPKLTPMFGASNKAMRLITCRDVHPCQACGGNTRLFVTWDHDIECPDCPGWSCTWCDGSGVARVRCTVAAQCSSCGGSGVGEIPTGSSCCCMAGCHKSGYDHLAVMTLTKADLREIEFDQSLTAQAKEQLAAVEKRLKAKVKA